MRHLIGVLVIGLLAGCSFSPPKPPEAKGDYRPVNRPVVVAKQTRPATFDFSFEGDIADSLTALKEVQPQIKVLPPVGYVAPWPVRVNLQRTTLESALRAIGEQGGDVADVVWNSTKGQASNQVYIRFRSADQQGEDKGAFVVRPENEKQSPIKGETK